MFERKPFNFLDHQKEWTAYIHEQSKHLFFRCLNHPDTYRQEKIQQNAEWILKEHRLKSMGLRALLAVLNDIENHGRHATNEAEDYITQLKRLGMSDKQIYQVILNIGEYKTERMKIYVDSQIGRLKRSRLTWYDYLKIAGIAATIAATGIALYRYVKG